jgi:hypothetical protein
VITAFVALLLSGCIGLDAFPIAARAGDTVTLALGSPEGMNRNNTSVSFEDSQGGIHDLTANQRGIFKLYPDKASKAWDSSATSTLVSSARHEAWLTVMALDLPSSLPAGAGTIRVTTTADYPTINAHINDVPIRIEILPGAGMSNPLEYVFGSTPATTSFGDVQDLEPRNSVAIHTDSSGTNLFGAIEIKLHIETDKGTNLAPSNVRVLMEDLMIITESRRNWFWDLDNGQDYTVTLLSPLGWLAENEAHFKIVFKQASVVGTPTITSIRYFDVNGAEVVGPSANQYTIVVDNG